MNGLLLEEFMKKNELLFYIVSNAFNSSRWFKFFS